MTRNLKIVIVVPLLAAVVCACGGGARSHTSRANRSAPTQSSRYALGVALAGQLLENAPVPYVTCYLNEVNGLPPAAFNRLKAELTGPRLHKVPPDILRLDIGCMKDPATLRLVRGQLTSNIVATARQRGYTAAYAACVARVIAHLPLPRVRQLMVAVAGNGDLTTLLTDPVRHACGPPGSHLSTPGG